MQVSTLAPAIPDIASHTHAHRARLLAPMLSYDASALALSFLPAEADEYTYHHLRRDIFSLCTSAGVTIGSRYTVPSAHLTIARFVTQHDILTQEDILNPHPPAQLNSTEGTEQSGATKLSGATKHPGVDSRKVTNLVDRIESINAWLHREYWPQEGKGIRARGEWIVGEEVGLDCRRGTLWYGGGETVRLGEGF